MADKPMFGGAFEVALRSGKVLTCGLERFKPWVALDGERLALPPSSGGHGGIELVVSPDERYAAAFLYSGQSQVGYAVLEADPLRLVAAHYYWRGESDAPQFSPDGQWLAMLASAPQMVRGTNDWFEEVADPDAEGTVVVDWAKLYVRRVPDGEVVVVDVGSEVALATDPDELAEWKPYDMLAWESPERVRVGTTSIAVPPTGAVIVPAPG
jgi:hypothetical protein